MPPPCWARCWPWPSRTAAWPASRAASAWNARRTTCKPPCATQARGEAERLRQAKLSALAEFAAGAGHEINNPLAVISGQAQYVLSHGEEWLASDEEGATRKALQAIIGQTKRVHAILVDLMQFARPAPSRPEWFDLPSLLGEVAASLGEQAGSRGVRLEVRGASRAGAGLGPTPSRCGRPWLAWRGTPWRLPRPTAGHGCKSTPPQAAT